MVAESNPMAYYRLVEQFSRLVTTKGVSSAGRDPGIILAKLGGSLLLPGLLSGDAHAKLLPSWEHSKAYMSAVASCVKGAICAAQQQQQRQQLGVARVEGSEQGGSSSAMTEHDQQMKEQVAACFFQWLPLMLAWLAGEANSMRGNPVDVPLFAFIRRTQPLEAKHLFTPRGIQLVALLWLARGVSAVGQLLFPCKSSLIAAIRASGDTSRDPQLGSGLQCDGASRSSSSQGTHSSSAPMRVKNIMETLITLTWCTEEVHLAACEGSSGHSAAAFRGSSSSTESTLPSAAAAAGDNGAAHWFSAALGFPASTASSLSTPSTAAPINPASTILKSIPKRLLKLPQNGLPEALVNQLDLIHGHLGVERRFPGSELSGEEGKVEHLWDMLKLADLLLTEVPNPLGCSYPWCVNMNGDSEVGLCNKACTGCNMVYYCSRQCQVAHWGAHRDLCKKFKKQQETPRQEEDGEDGSVQKGNEAQQQQQSKAGENKVQGSRA